jgi:N-acyl-D-amino-acid deacylase
LFSLEDAVWKLSGAPASRFGLKERGLVEEGSYADLVVLDPDSVQDHATFEEPHRLSTGVGDVLVNGVAIIRDGAPIELAGPSLPGRALRYRE